MKTRRPFRIFAWGVLLYHLAVIVWGAFVRATGSGAGCGAHWPLCNGTAIPRSPTLATLIEFSHRITSGLALTLAIGLVAWAFWRYPARHLVRRAAASVIVFELMEAVIGAALVLLGQVAKDTSMGRGFTLSIHLINTLLLVAALTVTAWASSKETLVRRSNAPVGRLSFILAGASILFLGVSGAITALGDTLFQSTSIAEGFRQDFASQSHLFLRLRIWHPVIAVLVSVALLLLCYRLVSSHFSVCVSQLAFALAGTIITQLGVGMINLALLAPIALQLLHLLLADAAWIAFVLLGAEVLFHEETPGPGSVPTYPAELLSRA